MSESDETSKDTVAQQPLVDTSRRNFLRGVATGTVGTLAAAALGHSVPRNEAPQPHVEQPQPEAAEALKTNEKRMVIDFFDAVAFDTRIQEILLQQNKSLVDLLKDVGVDDMTSLDSFKNANPTTNEQAEVLMLLYLKNKYEKNGDQVVEAGDKLAKELGVDFPAAERKNLSETVQIKELTIGQNNNPTLHISRDDQAVEQMIDGNDAKHISINMGTGEMYVTHDLHSENPAAITMSGPYPTEEDGKDSNGNDIKITKYHAANGQEITPEEFKTAEADFKKAKSALEPVLREPQSRIMTTEDGFQKDQEYQNLSRIVELALKFSDKTFYIGGGESSEANRSKRPNIHTAREQIQTERGKMPDNLVIVGVKHEIQGTIAASALGCDIYVDAEDMKAFGLSPESGNAASFVKDIATIFADKGLDRGQVEDALDLAADKTQELDEEIEVLSVRNVKTVLRLPLYRKP